MKPPSNNKPAGKRLNLNYQQLGKLLAQQKTQAYTMLILSLLTISFFGIFALRPTLNTIAKLTRQVEDSRSVDRKLTDKIRQLVQAQEEYSVIAAFVPRVKASLPEKPNYTQLLYNIDNLRANSSATIAGVSVDEVQLETEEAGSFHLSIDAAGRYISLEKLMQQIALDPRLMVITNYTLTDIGTQQQQPEQLQFNGSIEVPYVGKQ